MQNIPEILGIIAGNGVYPAAMVAPNNALLVTASNRAIFSHGVWGLGSGAANTETDEWDDGVLQEAFARLLFADYGYKADGSSALSLLRRDNFIYD